MSDEWTGWIRHDHKGCPCVGSYVEAEYADGHRKQFVARGGAGWRGGDVVRGPRGLGLSVPIVAYRIRTPRALVEMRMMVSAKDPVNA